MKKSLVLFCAATCLCLWATAQTKAQCGPGNGDCFSANGTPGCDIVDCCNAVCAIDPFCCDNNWDIACAGEAANTCGIIACCFLDGACQDVSTAAECENQGGFSQGDGSFCEGVFCPMLCGPDAGDCFAIDGNGTPGCDDADCCAAVCSIDSFCCETGWDDICASEAAENCPAVACCFLDGSCQDLNTPNCNDQGGNPQALGSICAGFACPVRCGPGNGDCFAVNGNGTTGCEDTECCISVCATDPFCCDAVWDGNCAAEAYNLCVGANCIHCPADVNFDGGRDGLDVQSMVNCLLNPANGPEFQTAPGCGCADVDGDLDVDADDLPPFVAAIIDASGPCPICGPGNGACFDLNGNGTPGCEDGGCCETVCSVDPFCCQVEWDGMCAAHANAICNPETITEACCLDVDACFDFVVGDCVFFGGVPQGLDSVCATTTCAPPGCGAVGSGSCISVPDGNPVDTGSNGCDDAACCTLVCTVDPFCCNFTYDQFCQARGRAICNGDATTGCITANGCLDVTVADCQALGGANTGQPCP